MVRSKEIALESGALGGNNGGHNMEGYISFGSFSIPASLTPTALFAGIRKRRADLIQKHARQGLNVLSRVRKYGGDHEACF